MTLRIQNLNPTNSNLNLAHAQTIKKPKLQVQQFLTESVEECIQGDALRMAPQ